MLVSPPNLIRLSDAGNFTLDVEGDISVEATGKDISFTNGVGTPEFIFNLENAPELDVDGNFTIDGSGLIKLDSATSNIDLVGNVTASGNISASGTLIANAITLPDNAISGDKVEGGTIASITISQLGGALDVNNENITNIDVNSGAIDGTTIGTLVLTRLTKLL